MTVDWCSICHVAHKIGMHLTKWRCWDSGEGEVREVGDDMHASSAECAAERYVQGFDADCIEGDHEITVDGPGGEQRFFVNAEMEWTFYTDPIEEPEDDETISLQGGSRGER